MYSQTARQFILKVIRLRKSIMAKDKSRRNALALTETMERLAKYLEQYDYNDRQMAKFMLRHRAEIDMILPGPGSGNHSKFINELNNLVARAYTILNQVKEPAI